LPALSAPLSVALRERPVRPGVWDSGRLSVLGALGVERPGIGGTPRRDPIVPPGRTPERPGGPGRARGGGEPVGRAFRPDTGGPGRGADEDGNEPGLGSGSREIRPRSNETPDLWDMRNIFVQGTEAPLGPGVVMPSPGRCGHLIKATRPVRNSPARFRVFPRPMLQDG
jgi:hypothetical protein